MDKDKLVKLCKHIEPRKEKSKIFGSLSANKLGGESESYDVIRYHCKLTKKYCVGNSPETHYPQELLSQDIVERCPSRE